MECLIRPVGAAIVTAVFFVMNLSAPASGIFPPWHGLYVSKKMIADAPASLGNGEDRSGREYYEWLRLRDPASGVVPTGIRLRELSFSKRIVSTAVSLKKGTAVGTDTVAWVQRGPRNVGGRTRAFGIDRRNPLIMLAGGASGGMWRSTDAGGSWLKVAPENDVMSTTSLVQDLRSGKEDTWYYGTGELRGNSASGGGGSLYRGDGMYTSTDNGLTWSKLVSTSTSNVFFDQPFDYVWNIALSRTNLLQDVVVAATLGTIQSSTDGGQTWTSSLGTITNDAGPRYTDVMSTSAGVFYATLSSKNLVSSNTQAVHKGIWRSEDGLTWVNILPPAWPTDYNRVVTRAAPSNENVVYVLAETPGTGLTGHMFWKYTYLSGDGSGSGGVWEDRSSFLPAESGLDVNAVFDSQTSYDLAIAVHPVDQEMVFIGGVNLYRSADAGQTPGTWKRIGGYASAQTYARYPNNHPDHHALVFHPNLPDVLFNGNDGGIFRTANPQAVAPAWTSLNNGYYTTQFYTVAVDHGTDSDQLVIGGMQDNGTWYTTSSSAADSWLEAAGGDGAYCQVTPGGASLYVSFQNGQTYRLSQNGSGRIDPAGGSGYLFINPFLLDPTEPRRMYMAGGTTIWRNSNLDEIPLGSNAAATKNWSNILQPELSGASITALGASEKPRGVLYFGTSAGTVYKLVDAFRDKPSPIDISVNAGFPSPGYVSSIAVDPYNADHVLVSFSNYGVRSIFASTNGGSGWSHVSGNLEEQADGSGNGPSVRWVDILPDSAAYYYFAGTSTGLYSTRLLNGASTAWKPEGAGTIGYTVVDMLDVRHSDGYVVVGTHGRGVFSGAIPVAEPPPPPPSPTTNQVPEVIALSRNYPNPFNPGTSVFVTLARSGHATVEVYDVAGRMVDRLADGEFSAGTTVSLTWDGTDHSGQQIAAGMYFIVARAAGMIRVTKATLIR